MAQTVEIPLWILILILAFAAVTAATHLLLPSVRWFFRRRLERAVARLNERLPRPIEPFKLARRYDTIQRLTYDPDVVRAASEFAAKNGLRDDVAVERAHRYAREIVPAFSATAYFSFAMRLSKWVCEALYRVRIEEDASGAYDAIPAEATVIYVINHRSNMDYVLVTYLAAKRTALSYAVGEWARVWPVSRLIRAMGGYFIRRKSPNLLYRKVLARYVQMAAQEGLTQAIFPEGGLSLDGKPAPPKLGIISYILAGAQDAGRPVVFVPVSVNYDRVFEDHVLTRAGEENSRRFRVRPFAVVVFVWKLVWRRVSKPSYRYGIAAVSFGAPLSLEQLSLQDAEDPVAAAASLLMDEVRARIPVLPVPLVCSVLIRSGAEPITTSRIVEHVASLNFGAGSVSLGDIQFAVQQGLDTLAVRKLITVDPSGVSVQDGALPVLAFYANSIAHLEET
ncbi:MAG: 1-acyl-sn-glycerol-3-phosphate acyltransferase [Pseudomonadota bacterium]